MTPAERTLLIATAKAVRHIIFWGSLARCQAEAKSLEAALVEVGSEQTGSTATRPESKP
jgi:hypothetical protein